MQRRNLLKAAALSVLMTSGPTRAQTYPSRPIRMVVPFAAAGPTDAFARLFADALGKQLGQAVVVENKAGGAGVIGTLDVKTSKPDGYALLFGTATTQALYNLIEPKPRYDASEDFDYVAILGGAPLALAVTMSMPATLKEVLDLARNSPKKLTYGSPGTGTLLHVATERLLQIANASITHVPYKGVSPALQDLLGGSLDMVVGTPGALLPLHKAGKLRLVGIATANRLELAPDVPTIAESAALSTPFEALLWSALAVPQQTPVAVKNRLAEAVRIVMTGPDMVRTLTEQGIAADLRVGDEAANAYVRSEAAKWKPVIAKLGGLTKG